jgi:DNA-binding CsgD family transcriptional regulator
MTPNGGFISKHQKYGHFILQKDKIWVYYAVGKRSVAVESIAQRSNARNHWHNGRYAGSVENASEDTRLVFVGFANDIVESKKGFRKALNRFVRKIAEDACAIDVRLLGMAIPFFCSDLITKTYSYHAAEMQYIWQFCYGAVLLLIAGLFIAKKRYLPHKELSERFVSTLGTVALGVSYVLLAVGVALGSIAFFYVVLIIGTIGLANCYMKWLSLFYCRSTRVAVASFLLAFSLGSLLRLGLSLVNPILAFVLAACIVSVAQIWFLSTIKSLKTAGGDTKETPTSAGASTTSVSRKRRTTTGVGQLIFLLVLFTLLSFILAVIRAHTAEMQYDVVSNTLNLVLRIVFPLFLCAYAVQTKMELPINTIYLGSIVLVITAVFLMDLLSDVEVLFSIVLTSFIRGLILMFIFLLIIKFAREEKYDFPVIFGIGCGSYVFFQGFGLFLHLNYDLTIDENLALNVVYLLVVVGLISLTLANRRLQKRATGSARALTAPATDDFTATVQASIQPLDAIQQRYDLTKREIEILALFCRGRSKRYIAEAFFISENTVRGHIKNLYHKCGVHTKQELIDLFEAMSHTER